MSDITTQGYVGVTNNIKRRLANHFSRLKHGLHDNQHFQRAYNIDVNLIVDILFEGSEEECYIQEFQLRPHRDCGWNINIGGTKPPPALGKPHAKGSKGPVKPLTSPDGLIFESRNAAALHYGVDKTTIQNWIKDPYKPWVKGGSLKQSSKYNIAQHNEAMKRPIITPRGQFESVKAASISYGVVHGTINYWLKTRSDQFFYLIKSEVSA
jgi:hypothetical protein